MREQRLMRRCLVRGGGQPYNVEHRRCAADYGRLQERKSDVTQSAAVIGGMVMLVLEGEG